MRRDLTLLSLLAAAFFSACESEQGSQPPQAFGDLRLIRSDSLNESKPLSQLADSEHLWGIGMPKGLDRELAIFDGSTQLGGFSDADVHHVTTPEDPDISFLAYAQVSEWDEIPIPDEVTTFDELEQFIAGQLGEAKESMVRVEAETESLSYFVVRGMGDLRPDPLRSFLSARTLGRLEGRRIEAVGVFTTERRGIITSPGESLHLHFRTLGPSAFVGHLDNEVVLKPGGRLLLPTSR